MKKFNKAFSMFLIVLMSLMLFCACSTSEKWTITKFTVTDKDGTADMIMSINSGILELFNDGKCTLLLAGAQGVTTSDGTWMSEKDTVITKIPDFEMTLLKSKNKLTSTKTVVLEDGSTVVTTIEFSK